MFDAWHRHRWDHKGKYFSGTVQGEYEMLPHPIQMPHPPLYMAGGTDRSIGYSGRNGFGLMLSTLPGVETLAAQTSLYKRELARRAPSGGRTRRRARSTSRAGSTSPTPTRGARRYRGGDRAATSRHFGGTGTGGYLGSVSRRAADQLRRPLASTLLHGSAETVIARLREMQARTGMTSLLLHYPPYYGRREGDEEPQAVRRARDPCLPPPARQGPSGGVKNQHFARRPPHHAGDAVLRQHGRDQQVAGGRILGSAS
jgi:alkanesulfonate monooxygenase SsuD/methylene tetrahydromethanopterin reductase-like flavin-dependent oxidoreductase (luciferase family)